MQSRAKAMRGLIAALIMLPLAGCGGMSMPGFGGVPLTSQPFDQQAYQNAADVKAQTMALVDRAGERYASRRAEADALRAAIDRAFSYASSQPNNQLSIEAWTVVRNPQGGSVGNYLALWQQRGALPPKFRAEKRRQLAAHLDYVVCIESSKQAQSTCPNPLGAGS